MKSEHTVPEETQAGREAVQDGEDFLRRIREAKAVEVRGSLYLKNDGMMYLLDPTSDPIRAELGLSDEPLYVVCHRSRLAEVRDVVERIRVRQGIDSIVRSLAAQIATATVIEDGEKGPWRHIAAPPQEERHEG